jgi:DNA-binding NarL/FixJ family response regulator
VGCRRLTVSFPSGRTSVALSVATLEGGQAAVLHRMLDLGPGGNGAAAPRLTRRQSQVLHLLADGVRVREIARRLVLAEPTVRNHVHAILVELGVHSQIEAVARARELGLLRLAD